MRAEFNRPLTFILLVLLAGLICFDLLYTGDDLTARQERIQQARFEGSISAR
jgi:hypothetical protein